MRNSTSCMDQSAPSKTPFQRQKSRNFSNSHRHYNTSLPVIVGAPHDSGLIRPEFEPDGVLVDGEIASGHT